MVDDVTVCVSVVEEVAVTVVIVTVSVVLVTVVVVVDVAIPRHITRRATSGSSCS